MARSAKVALFAILASFVSLLAFADTAEDSSAQAAQMVNELARKNPVINASPGPGPNASGSPQPEVMHSVIEIRPPTHVSIAPWQPSQLGASPQPSGSSPQSFAISPEMAQKFEWAQKFLNNPLVQKYLHVLTDPEIQQDVHVLMEHPQRYALLGWEFGWILMMFIFKAWRLMKAKGFFSMIFTQMWTSMFLLFGASFVIPRIVLGAPYEQLIHHLLQKL